MKLFFSVLLLTVSFTAVSSGIDSTNGSWNMKVRGDYGFVIAHRPALEPVQEAHVKGFEVSLSRTTYGKEEWENIYHFPDYGITLAGFDLGSPSFLGMGFVVYPFIDFPLSKKSSGGFHFRYGMGLGYVEKIFNADDNIKNSAVGSHINGVIHFDLHFEKKVSAKTSLELGAGITHYSNGSIAMPNLGLNIATVNLAFSHSFGKSTAFNHRTISKKVKTPEIQLYAGGFMKKINPPEGNDYFAFTVSSLRFKPINHKSAWGFGADIFYDNSLSARIEREGEKATSIDNFRAGIYGAYEVGVGNVGIMFNMGFYLYNPWEDDGNVYQRICTRYYFKKTFICLNLKSHYARADFIELGFGYRFLKNNK